MEEMLWQPRTFTDFHVGCSVAVPSGEDRARMLLSRMQLRCRWSRHRLPSPGQCRVSPKHGGSSLPASSLFNTQYWLREHVGCFNARLLARLLGAALEARTGHLPSIVPQNWETTVSAAVTTPACICAGFVAVTIPLLSLIPYPKPPPPFR